MKMKDVVVEDRVAAVGGVELEAEAERKRNLWFASLKTIEVVPKSRFQKGSWRQKLLILLSAAE